jgi:hypothetical protein
MEDRTTANDVTSHREPLGENALVEPAVKHRPQ